MKKKLFSLCALMMLCQSLGLCGTYTVSTSHNAKNGDAGGDFRSALASAAADSSGSATVIVPAGEYNIESVITLPSSVASNISIVGEGEGISRIICNYSGNVFDLTLPNGSHYVSLSWISILSNHPGSGAALHVTYSSGTPSTGLIAKYVQISAYKPSPTQYLFATGIQLDNAPHSQVTCCILQPADGTGDGVGIDVHSESDYLTVSDSQINNWDHGVQFDSDEADVTMNRCYWIESHSSIYSAHTVAELGMNGGHVDLNNSGSSAIYIANASACSIENILFFSEDSGISIEMPTANSCSIDNNEFFDNTGNDSSRMYQPIVMGASSSSYGDMISGNAFMFTNNANTSSQKAYNLGSHITSSYVWSNLIIGPHVATPSPAGGTDTYNSVCVEGSTPYTY